ncbi:MAG TPA: chemotaxis-specific protein-glutamate methyltransferase CheB [Acidobacteriaceae bacterium]|jgi:two-component system chemotaxis response regulator CheB|nr:chemotaxis-specific protein-glutamate methyltransferase CheB [Acidobacteriaceae bacterium]
MQTPSPKPIRVLAIDDSSTMRHMYQQILATCPDIALIGVAGDGPSGIEMVQNLNPDLVVLDIDMPQMDGLTVLTRLRERQPRLPVVMCSTLTQRGAAITLEALFRGAADYVAKPHFSTTPQAALEGFREPLVERIRALGSRVCWGPASEPANFSMRQTGMTSSQVPVGVVVMGASTGGPQALEQVLCALPADFPVPVLVVQHIPPLFLPLLAERLHQRCRLQVQESVDGMPLQPGFIWLARGDWHLRIASVAAAPGRNLAGSTTAPFMQRLAQDAPIHYCRPAVDALFQSAADIYGAASLGVVLTGMGTDATEGARAIRNAGGTVLAQDAATSTIWGMPGSVVRAGLAHAVLPLDQIAGELLRRVGATAQTSGEQETNSRGQHEV